MGWNPGSLARKAARKTARDDSLSLVGPLTNDGHVEERHTHGSHSQKNAGHNVVPFLTGVSPAEAKMLLPSARMRQRSKEQEGRHEKRGGR